MVFGAENTLAVGEQGKGSGDGYRLLERNNGIGGGSGEGFAVANRGRAAHAAIDVAFSPQVPTPVHRPSSPLAHLAVAA